MYSKTVLQNHLRIISHPMADRESVAIGLWLGVGGRYEDDKIKGAAHFLEHILFKGSHKYSCQEIKELVEGVGGSLNAFTSEEYTCFFAKIPRQYLNRTFDILADMVFEPLIDKKDVEKERFIILEEIKMYRDLPQHLVLDHLESLMWPDHPLGKNLAGTYESVSGMTVEDLRDFHHQFYPPNNIVVSVCGAFSKSAFEGLVTKKVRPYQEKSPRTFLKARQSQVAPQAHFHTKDTEQMHVALGTFGLPMDHDDKYALSLLNIILGANMSSRLFNEVREKRGLAYAISSAIKSLKDTGMFLIRAGVDNHKIVEALKVIRQELKKISNQGVTKAEFSRAKDYYLGQILLSLEDTLDHMFWIGDPMISLDRTYTPEEVLKKVKKVTLEDIQRVAQGIFQEKNLNLSVVGPLTDRQKKELSTVMGIDGKKT